MTIAVMAKDGGNAETGLNTITAISGMADLF